MIAAKGLTRRFAACAALVAFALLSFVSAPVRADEVQWAGVTIAYTNAVVTYSNPDDLDVSDLILTYTDISAPGSLTLPEEWSVRYLVVGGGGAGGTVPDANFRSSGQGGGGGAGGFATNTIKFAAQTYSIYVGAGGLPADDQTSSASGGDGGGSAITNTTTAAAVASVLGGGGGDRVSMAVLATPLGTPAAAVAQVRQAETQPPTIVALAVTGSKATLLVN